MLAALVLGVIGVTLALLSLVWQAATHVLSGPRIKVTIAEGLSGPGGTFIGPPSIYTPATRAKLEEDGYTQRTVAVTARNVGRMAATLSMWSIRFGNGAVSSHVQAPWNRPMPYRLDAHDEVTWYQGLDNLRDLQATFADQSDAAATATAVVDLAVGKKVESARRLLIRSDAGNGDSSVARSPLARALRRTPP